MSRARRKRDEGYATGIGAVVAPALALAAVLLGWRTRWLCDDAFISFRYARNLVEGQGLVFNAGEYVEGYSNLLWTLWIAAGLALGAEPGLFAQLTGIACYGLLIYAMARVELPGANLGEGVSGPSLPLAATIAALHPALWDFATSGLETMAFSLLACLGLLLALASVAGLGRLLVAGSLLGLAAVTRADGLLFAPLAVLGAWLSAAPGRRLKAALCVAGPIACIAGAQLVFRGLYYGELLPNTYHAKSAQLAWYGQGLRYLGLFLQRSWALGLLVGYALLWTALRGGAERPRDGAAHLRSLFLLAAGFLYVFYVVRVGGDFMYGRMLVPALAPLLLGAEGLLRERWPARPGRLAGLALAVAFATLLTPRPSFEQMWPSGIVDERAFPDPVRERAGRAQELRRYFEGLDVVIAFTGGDAKLMYEARIPVAIEAETGLTDPTIARQVLEARGRPGHEKHADLDYLIDRRGANFVLRKRAVEILGLREAIPLMQIQLGQERVYPLRWDPALMAELRRRGAKVPNFGRELARVRASAGALDPSRRRELERKLERFVSEPSYRGGSGSAASTGAR
ncbi:MAG: hypothetical protein OEZ06_06520 [Myxococcales bacterium]|nr:hypothetical protein [Myxococcales bacterium]